MTSHRPYAEDAANALYDLLFCDEPERFGELDGPFAPISTAAFDEAAVRAIAEDDDAESRVRALAYHRLRREGAAVPRGVLLGVIAEVRLENGLDTLAAYADGRVRYLSQSGAIVIVEEDIAALSAPVAALFAAAQPLVERIGPWEGERLAPPGVRRVRLSFLVSDGLHFGEGDMADLARDRLGGPVFNAAAALLAATVDFASSGGDAAAAEQ